MNSRPTADVREKVAQRALGCCEYCKSQAEYSPDTFSIEHIVPIARDGGQALANLALSCQGCNNRKFTSIDAEDPVNGERAPLFHPRRDHWSDHFAWDAEYTLMVGLTPTGRATIEKLDLNRTGVVNLRRVMLIAGLHPPVED